MTQCGSPSAPDFFPGARPSRAGMAMRETMSLFPRAAFTTIAPRLENLFPMRAVEKLTVHHTGFPEPWLGDELTATARHLEDILMLHMDSTGRNWADIGYHYAVDRMGRIWQLRDLRYQGAHVKNHNSHNIGIVVLGNFDLQIPPQSQLTALEALLRFMLNAFPGIHIGTHRELADSPTSCPGQYLQLFMDQHIDWLSKEFK